MLQRLALPALLFSLLMAGCSSVLTSNKEYLYQEIYYMTTREDTGSQEPDRRFNGDRGETRFGVAMLAVDPGKTFGSFAAAQPNHTLQQDELVESQPRQRVVDLGEDAFLAGLAAYTAGEETPPPILIYIHGYLKGFRRAAIISAQLRYELDFKGPVISFSWPSTNSVSGYVADLENLRWSEPELLRLIELLHRKFPDSPIHIIAHSMGNRALINTLVKLQRRYPEPADWPLGDIVFIAPDVDRDIFMRDTTIQLQNIPSRKTLYVSGKDFPLFASATVHQYPRLGDARYGVPVLEGIETVDVSDAVPLFDGHGYYEANKETIEDLYYLLRKGLGADQRPSLEAAESDEGKYWRLKEADNLD